MKELIIQMAEIRKRQDITYNQISQSIGKETSAIHRILKSGKCHLHTACLLANALGYELKLVKKDENTQP